MLPSNVFHVIQLYVWTCALTRPDVNHAQQGTVWIPDEVVILARHVTWRRKIGGRGKSVTVFCLSLIFVLHYLMNASVVFSASFHGIVLFWTWLISPGATGYKRQYKKRGISNKRSALSVSDKGKLEKENRVLPNGVKPETFHCFCAFDFRYIATTYQRKISKRRIVNHHENIWYVRYINILPLPFAGVVFFPLRFGDTGVFGMESVNYRNYSKSHVKASQEQAVNSTWKLKVLLPRQLISFVHSWPSISANQASNNSAQVSVLS